MTGVIYINGVPFRGSIHIDGLVNIDQVYDPTSENPQSGIAMGGYLEKVLDGVRPTDQEYDPESENPPSGIAIEAHLTNLLEGVTSTDQLYDPTSENAQSGTAVYEAIKRGLSGIVFESSLKMEYFMRDVLEDGLLQIRIEEAENKNYIVCGVFVTTLSGETVLCDVEVNDYTCSGNSGMCNITLSFLEPPDETLSVRILYKEVDV